MVTTFSGICRAWTLFFFFFLSMLCFITCSPRYVGRARKGFLFSSAIDFFHVDIDTSGTFLFTLWWRPLSKV